MRDKLIIGSRGSILALKQAELIKKKLEKNNGDFNIEIKVIKTSGDMNLTVSLQSTSLKDMFVKEIEQELLDGKIDLAVHSMKDMPIKMPEGLILAGVIDRADKRDVLLSRNNEKLEELKSGAIIGTSSLRRLIQIKKLRTDIEVKEIRGNIHTRIKKMESGDYDALILAAAGLKRVGLESKIDYYFSEKELMPAPAQGALCIQCRKSDKELIEFFKKIEDEKQLKEVRAEREFARLLNAGCKTPIGASAKIEKGILKMDVVYFDGEKTIKLSQSKKEESYLEIAKILADKVKEKINEK